jgi:ribonuclease R
MKTNREKILGLIDSPAYRPVRIRELARQLDIPEMEYPEFRNLVKRMVASGELGRHRRGKVGAHSKPESIKGRLQVTKSGRAFVQPDDESAEIAIAPKGLSTGLDGDKVAVRVFGRDNRGRPVGEVVEVIERNTTQIVGKYFESRFHSFVVPDNPRLNIEVNVEPPRDKQFDLRNGVKVVVALLEWKDPNDVPRGKILEILGMSGDPNVDVLSVIHTFNLPTKFPPAVEQEAEEISEEIPQSELKRRVDLRNKILFTIDPEDAKDHDDAVSLDLIKQGYRLGVHIADVSHYVQDKSRLDKEARSRAASAYLVDRVLPMLPERLSNNICSLREKEDRLALSIFIDLDKSGNVLGSELAESVISSQAKLSYDQVQHYLDTGKGFEKQKRTGKKLEEMADLAKTLTKRRLDAGAIDFELPEYKVFVDENGIVEKIERRQRKLAHRMIEEFMLLANQQVAQYMLSRSLPSLYRIHPPPDEQKLRDFQEFAENFGHTASFGSPPKPKNISDFLHKIREHEDADILNEVLVRSMQKARYQPENIGHFGLAFTAYLHFTSPIRRFPDLIVHRILKQHLNKALQKSQYGSLKSALARVGKHCSEQELVIMEAERETISIKQAEYMSRHLGDVYDGVISGMLGFGFFVRIIEIGAEGMVRLSSIEDDYFHADVEKHVIIGRKSGRKLHLGEKVKVQVVSVSIENGEIDLRLISGNAGKKSEASRKKAKGRRRRRN